jgi:Flp pilus assembly protein TadG
MSRFLRWSRRLGSRTQRGQTLLELAVFLPLILIFGLACIQFGVIFMAYQNVIQVTRDATRWVAVHPHVLDGNANGADAGTTNNLIKSRLPAGLSSSALTMTFTPACTSLTSGKCAARTSGAQISVRSQYNISSHLFVPTTLGWGTLSVTIPSTLPAYEIFMQVEPS